MDLITATRPNTYTGNPLDRMDNRRHDADWVAARLAHGKSRFLPVWRGRTLFTGLGGPGGTTEKSPAYALLDGSTAEALGRADRPWALLGVDAADRALFAFDLSDAADDPATLLPAASGQWEDLRALAGLLRPEEAAVIAQARGLMYWRTRHRFCGVCGAACEQRTAGWALQCTGCGTQHFPRTDSAVIMLVRHRGPDGEERALLAHSTRFPSTTMYSTLAGFVEPGESLEEAVRREVWEESGIRVGRVFYHSSQPWPFPGNLMLGFHAEALTTDITIDPTEIRDARWFTRAELRDPAGNGFALPRVDSIARRLIEDWMAHA